MADKFLGNFIFNIMKSKLKDPEFVKTTTRTILNEQFRNITPNKIEYAFEHDEDLTKYIEGNLNKLNDVQRFKVYVDYKLNLKAYSKKRFDPFCRWDRITVPYSSGK